MNGFLFFSHLSSLLTFPLLWELFTTTSLGCALLCSALHPTGFTNYMFSLSTPLLFGLDSSLTWLNVASDSHDMFSVSRHVIIAIL